MEHLFSKKWSVWDYTKFVTPSVLSLVSISLYMVVDALFISRYAGPYAMASVNIIMPFFSLTFGIGIMIAAGASALIGIELGQKRNRRAYAHLSLTFAFLACVTLFTVITTNVIGATTISRWLGATEKLLPYCEAYLNAILFGISAVVIQIGCEFFTRLDGKPMWALCMTMGAGITNITMDYVLIAKMGMGIRGAGTSSSIGVLVAISIGTYYLLFKAENLRFTRFRIDFSFLKNTVINGSSEMVSEIAGGVKTLAFNFVILRYAGEYGVAAISILMYMYYSLLSVHMGLTMGIAPVISYNYGSRNFAKIQELLKISARYIVTLSVLTFALALLYGKQAIAFFANDQPDVITVAYSGLAFFAFTFLLEGISIFASGFFTSVSNGKISAMISFLKSFVFTLGFIALLPHVFELNGVWLSVPLSELGAVLLSAWFFMKYRQRYVWPQPATA